MAGFQSCHGVCQDQDATLPVPNVSVMGLPPSIGCVASFEQKKQGEARLCYLLRLQSDIVV